MTEKESKYNKECEVDCVVHKLATHNTCVFCSACRNSPYYREDFLGKSDEEIEAIRKEVKRTERGWAGHFCCSSSCKFRRNTLLECDDIQIVVSTVGAMYNDKGKLEEIGLNRHYETMAFHVNPKSGDYKDADFSREILFESKGALKWHKKGYIDNEANEMHEAVVKEISDNLAKGWLYED